MLALVAGAHAGPEANHGMDLPMFSPPLVMAGELSPSRSRADLIRRLGGEGRGQPHGRVAGTEAAECVCENVAACPADGIGMK